MERSPHSSGSNGQQVKVKTSVGPRISALRRGLREFFPRLATVSPVLPGLPGDGLSPRGGAPLDLPAGDHAATLKDALEAWRTNPLARRLVSLVTAYTVGDGIHLSSRNAPLDAFIRAFWAHPGNRIELELGEWSDELSRSGELFLALFTDPFSGISTVRAIPASVIDEITWQEGDYRTELAYRDLSAGLLEGGGVRWWKSPAHPELTLEEPVLLHYAVNRPVGALRGESDLAPILPWLRRYARWLEDRVRLNASVRAFLWVVNAPARVRGQLIEQYRRPPEPGSVIVADEAERWTAVTPNLHAADAEKDGRAMRWMITAAGPGTALLDLGEGEDSNLATGQVMQEQKRRFLRRRQRYLVHLLTDLTLHAFARWVAVTGATVQPVSANDVIALAPDISPEDNAQLAQAAEAMVRALQGLAGITGMNDDFRRLALRLFVRFSGETAGAEEMERILATHPDAKAHRRKESQRKATARGAAEEL